MIAADTLAYTNRLAGAHPAEKCLFGALMLFAALFAGPVPAATVFCFMSGLIIFKAGIPAATYGKLLLTPAAFILIGAGFAMIDIFPGPHHSLPASASRLHLGAGIALRGLGSVACLLFVCLTTPFIDIIGLMRRLRFPGLLLELAEMTYRCIFIIGGDADTITRAQSARLGYASLRAGFRSAGMLAAALLVRSMEDSRRMQQAYESRCGSGPVSIARQHRPVSIPVIAGILLAVLVIAATGLP